MTHSARIAITVSEFNKEITSKLLEGALARLQALAVADDNTSVAWVPGAVELPLMAQRLAQTQRYDAIICLGAVIRGDTDHYDYVCQSVTYGCQRVSLTENIPVIFGVLTTNDEAQAWERLGGSHGHKGADAADTAIAMIKQLEQVGKKDRSNDKKSYSENDKQLV